MTPPERRQAFETVQHEPADPGDRPAVSLSATKHGRLRVAGKFLTVGGEKLWVRGVTYGTFRHHPGAGPYPGPEVVERDFAQMVAAGFNAVRTYTVPPRWLLDIAHEQGLFVMVGLPWEQHVAFLDDRQQARAIERRVRAAAHLCAGHPALLCYAVGNEIPSAIVRLLGARRVERFLERLGDTVKTADPTALVTYVNYPSTEYLELPSLDLVCFNVYLESQERLDAYLARLQNIAGDRPLIMGEIGLDSLRNGEDTQARVLEWQVRTAFAAGCAGAFVFGWTDEWHRGGYDVVDWNFGLTRRDRQPKPALATVREALADIPFPRGGDWPSISVVVCSYNGAATIRDCLEGLRRLDYPDYEVIVIDDGSTDATAQIAESFGVRVISTPNRGLSRARNLGLAAASGEIVAYTDDDARPDPHWLTYLAAAFLRSDHIGIGGPNIAPPGDGSIADCVANAPGGPVHVLLADRIAEHIPGCNMAFRKAGLQKIGGFDPQFRTAGDDVDVCWRLQEQGWGLGFEAGAMVWHHRRNSLRAYWKQQVGYGRAEAMLERKWPEKYNSAGHVTWTGRLYGKGLTRMLRWSRGRIYQGRWGTAPFQSVYAPASSTLGSLPLMPEWYFVILLLACLTTMAPFWAPLRAVWPLLVLAIGASIVQAASSAARATFPSARRWRTRLRLRALTAILHLLQPLARLWGRAGDGLTPWRRRGATGFAFPSVRRRTFWSENWQAPTERLEFVESALRSAGVSFVRGGDFDRWDLEVRGGLMGAARALMAVEDHGSGRQLTRFRVWPRLSGGAMALLGLSALLCAAAVVDRAGAVSVAFGVMGVTLVARMVLEAGGSLAAVLRAIDVVGCDERGA